MPNLTFNVTVGAQSQVTPTNLAFGKVDTDNALSFPQGFGNCDFNMLPMDVDGFVDTRPGPGHREWFIGIASGDAAVYTAADIEAAESLSGGTVTGAWLVLNQAVTGGGGALWGQHPDYGIDTSLRFALTTALYASSAAQSTKLHFKCGGTYASVGDVNSDQNGFPRHPIIHTSYGTGAAPIFETDIDNSGAAESNIVLENLDFTGITSPAFPAARQKTALKIQQSSKNWFINRCDFSKRDISIQGAGTRASRFTFFGTKINDTQFLRPFDGPTGDWFLGGADSGSGETDYMQGIFAQNAEKLLLKKCSLVHCGWGDGYDDTVYGDSTPPDGALPHPPSQYNHCAYFQVQTTDMAFIECSIGAASSQGLKNGAGATLIRNMFYESPNHAYTNETDATTEFATYPLIVQNVFTGSRWVPTPRSVGDSGIAYTRALSVFDSRATEAWVQGNAILNLADPNSVDSYETGKPTTVAAAGGGTGPRAFRWAGDDGWQTSITSNTTSDYTSTNVLYGWLDFSDENALASSIMDDLTLPLFVDDDNSATPGTATRADALDWMRDNGLRTGEAVDWFLGGLGVGIPANYTAGTNTFTPDAASDGLIAASPLNWSLDRAPVDGDTIALNGYTVTNHDNLTAPSFSLGVGGTWYQYGGTLDIASLAGTGTINISETGEVQIAGLSSSDMTINVTLGAGLVIDGDIASGLSISVSGDHSTVVIVEGNSLTIATGETLTITGDGARVGFDGGAGGTATLNVDGTLAFVAGNGGVSPVQETVEGFAGKDATTNQNAAQSVVSAVVLDAASVLDIDATGLASATAFDLIVADSVTGTFGTVNVTGGSGTVSYPAGKVVFTTD